MRVHPAFAPYLEEVERVLQTIDEGRDVNPATLPLIWRGRTPSQAIYWTDMARQNPAKLATNVQLPILVIQGTADRIVAVEDAQALVRAAPRAQLHLLPDVNHLLTTKDQPLVIEPSAPQVIASFVRDAR